MCESDLYCDLVKPKAQENSAPLQDFLFEVKCNRLPQSSRCLRLINSGNCPGDGLSCESHFRRSEEYYPIHFKGVLCMSSPKKVVLGYN